MIEQIADSIRPVLEFPLVRKTRRNHALEHATIHVLSSKLKNTSMAGRSTDGGFILLGNVPTEDVKSAAEEALRRLNKGEDKLALHPNCGTNMVTAGALTTFAGWVGLRAGNKNLTPDRISWTMVLMILAMMAAQPIGMQLQKHITTEGDPGDLELVDVVKSEIQWFFMNTPMTIHRIITRRG